MRSQIRKQIELFKKRRFEKSHKQIMRQNLKELNSDLRLSPAQKKEMDEYFIRLTGKKISYYDHEYYYALTGVFDKRYIPEYLYRSEIIGRLNNLEVTSAYSDKNITDKIFNNVNYPKTIIKNINGFFYNEDNNPITKAEAIDVCSNLNNVFIKPSLASRGRGIKRLNIIDGIVLNENKSIESLLDSYGINFIIQEGILQHEVLSKLNPSSINTIRLVTYRDKSDTKLLNIRIRIGRKGKVIDNDSGGGISVIINKNTGALSQLGYSKYGKDNFEKTDNGTLLHNYKIPFINNVIEKAKELHTQLPYAKIAAWDFSINQDGKPIFIEWNSRPDLNQAVNGPEYGDYTEEILKEAYSHINTRNKNW